MPRTEDAPAQPQNPTLVARLWALAGFGRTAPPANLMPQRPLEVLVLCTGDPARAILGEALICALGKGRLRGHAASSHPTMRVDPLALRVLAEAGIRTRSFYSRGCSEFMTGTVLDVVITIGDADADDTCPWLPGAALRAHWPMPDPATVQGTESQRLAAFREAFATLHARVARVVELAQRERDRDAFAAALHATATPAQA